MNPSRSRSGSLPIADGGEEFNEQKGDYPEQSADRPRRSVGLDATEPYQDGYLPHYDSESHLIADHDTERGPQWGLEEDSDRPRGPPCRECGEHTDAESFGWGPETGETVDWAVCEDCGLGWGPTDGWVDIEETSDSNQSD